MIDKLGDIFSQQDDVFWQCIKQVYRDFLFELDALDLEINSDDFKKDLLPSLAAEWTEKQIIQLFIPRLLGYLLANNRYQEARQQIHEIAEDIYLDSDSGIKENDFKQNIRNFKQEYNKLLEGSYYFLIIEIKESESYPNSFQISGWLDKNNGKGCLKLNNQQLGVDTKENKTQEQRYKKENIEAIVKDFITQITHVNSNKLRLIIEFLLPSSLFGWEVDKWKLDSSGMCLGIVHEVRIRSLDRLKPDYQPHNRIWEDKWRHVRNCVRLLPQFFSSDVNCDTNILVGQLNDETIVGLKLTSALKSNHGNIASALYRSGTPIALWFRSEPPEGNCKTELDNLLQHDLSELSKQVRKQRSQPECHISLIWDDPNRLIPHYQLQ